MLVWRVVVAVVVALCSVMGADALRGMKDFALTHRIGNSLPRTTHMTMNSSEAVQLVSMVTAHVEAYLSGKPFTCDKNQPILTDVKHISTTLHAHTRDAKQPVMYTFNPSGQVMPFYFGHTVQFEGVIFRKGRDMNLVVELFSDRESEVSMWSMFVRYPVHVEVEEAVMKPFSLLCYNIWNYNEQWQRRATAIAQTIRKTKPDVVAFQEVRYDSKNAPHGKESFETSQDYSGSQIEHLTRRIRSKIPYWFVSQPAMTYFVDGRWFQYEGLATLTKQSVVHTEHRLLSRTGEKQDDHQRAVLCTSIAIPDLGRVDVCTAHLSLAAKAQVSNAKEIMEMAEELAQYEFEGYRHKARFTIVTGDFNAEPHHEAVMSFISNGYHDIFALSQRDTLSYGNWDNPSGLTFNTKDMKLRKRIDFAFIKASKDSSFHVQKFELLGHKQEGQPVASDHLALLARLKLYNTADGAAEDNKIEIPSNVM